MDDEVLKKVLDLHNAVKISEIAEAQSRIANQNSPRSMKDDGKSEVKSDIDAAQKNQLDIRRSAFSSDFTKLLLDGASSGFNDEIFVLKLNLMLNSLAAQGNWSTVLDQCANIGKAREAIENKIRDYNNNIIVDAGSELLEAIESVKYSFVCKDIVHGSEFVCQVVSAFGEPNKGLAIFVPFDLSDSGKVKRYKKFLKFSNFQKYTLENNDVNLPSYYQNIGEDIKRLVDEIAALTVVCGFRWETKEISVDGGFLEPIKSIVQNKTEVSESKKQGACFIATAASGSYDDPLVLPLRYFRDYFLMTNYAGVKFVNCYYALSPNIALIIQRRSKLRFFIKWFAIVPISYFCRLLARLHRRGAFLEIY